MVYALHLLFVKPKPKQEMFCEKSFVTTCVFHMYRVNFVGHFNNDFDFLEQAKKKEA